MSCESSSKRQREGSADGDDQSLIMLQTVADFQKIENPKIKDLSSLLINFIKFSVDNKRIDKLEANLNDIEVDVYNQKLDIANIKSSIEIMEKKFSEKIEFLTNSVEEWKQKYEKLETAQLKNFSSTNTMLQSKIDNDLIIRGFPEKPNSRTVCDNFLNVFQLDYASVSTHYYFPYKSKFSGKITHNVIIRFREIDTKLDILKRKKDMGPMLLNRIQPDMQSSSFITLNYSNRLSKFNLSAVYQLTKAKERKQIVNIRFHNLCFAAKVPGNDDWQRVTNYTELNKLTNQEI
jgi:hypothetical protein